MERQPPGRVRDSIVGFLAEQDEPVGLKDIHSAVEKKVGEVSSSSIRSYLNLNTPQMFERVGRGQYLLRNDGRASKRQERKPELVPIEIGKSLLYHTDCIAWLAQQDAHLYSAVVSDPPYGLLEYTAKEQTKLRAGKGGVWRIPPSFDGHARAPLPRFTVLDDRAKLALNDFFVRVAVQLMRVTVPGANVVLASNPLLMHIVSTALVSVGFEARGSVIRQVMTMRGGDRPKNAHREFPDISVMPRSMWEPWLVFRHPLIGRVQDNLRQWKTGGFRRPSSERPFGDLIRSAPTGVQERRIAPHPSLKPQKFLREIVRASLPLGEGIVLDPFAGSGSTLAAANAVGYSSVGIERDEHYIRLASRAIPRLAALAV